MTLPVHQFAALDPLPQLLRDQRRAADESHLSLLSAFHFVGAGLALFALLFLLLHGAIMSTVFNNPKIWEGQKGTPPPVEIFAVLKWFYVVGGLWFIASGVLNVISGVFLRTRKHRTFSMVVAGLNCLHMPLGTILGVFTLVVLVRDSVAELYAARLR